MRDCMRADACANVQGESRDRQRPAHHKRSPIAPRSIVLSVLFVCALLFGPTANAGAVETYDVRGEWSYTLTCTCGQNATGTALFTEMDSGTGKFSGTTILNGAFSGTASGTVTGAQASLNLILPSTPLGEMTFAMPEGAINAETNEITGSGAYNGGGAGQPTGVFTGKLVRTLAQIEQEEAEKAAQEKAAKEKAEKELKEKEQKEEEERPLREKAEKEAKEKELQERAAQEKAALEKAAQEKAALEKAATEKTATSGQGSGSPSGNGTGGSGSKGSKTTSPSFTAKTLTIPSTGLVSLSLSNPGGSSLSGNVTLTVAPSGKAATTKGKGKPVAPKPVVLGSASFTIPAHGTKTVKVKLSKSGRAQLSQHKVLHVLVKIVARAGGGVATVKTYKVTLRASTGHTQR
jgi:hypothetical protein